jgi:hypothetical protein
MEEKVILNTNAYFYNRTIDRELKTEFIDTLFEDVSENRLSDFLYKTIKSKSEDYPDIVYSFCIFKYLSPPPFLETDEEDLQEVKLAYLLVIEYNKFIIINKRNIGNLKKLYKVARELDYYTISRLYLSNETLFKKFALKNMDFSDSALRHKTIEANDIRNTLSAFGANRYILSIMRIQNKSDLLSLTMSTARINYLGSKNHLPELFKWVIDVVEEIEQFIKKDTYLDLFSLPLKIEEHINSLVPISILFSTENIVDDIESGKIQRIIYKNGDHEKNISNKTFMKVISYFSYFMNTIQKDDKVYNIVNDFIKKDFMLRKNKKSFTISSKYLKSNYFFDMGRSEYVSILDYVNRNSSFMINFSKPDMIYYTRALFQDHKLLSNTDYFLSIFESDGSLNFIEKEKDEDFKGISTFSQDTLFGYICEKYKESEYIVCDDLGDEWADFITIKSNQISFIHAKSGILGMSATSFQDIVGQAIKNLGNFSPQGHRWKAKIEKWNKNYSTSDIKRIVKGSNSSDLIESYTRSLLYPNQSKTVVLVINFISKTELKSSLQKLKAQEDFKQKNSSIQILWYISSLIACCNELGIMIKILCRE